VDECKPLVRGGSAYAGSAYAQLSPSPLRPTSAHQAGGNYGLQSPQPLPLQGGANYAQLSPLPPVGRCRLTVSNPALEAPMVSARDTRIS
jgi:hypothetical protein